MACRFPCDRDRISYSTLTAVQPAKHIRRLCVQRARFFRVSLALLVLLTFLSSIFPPTTIAGGEMCQLACCAGRAPHAAGSCMNGSCHAFLSRAKHIAHHELPPVLRETESLCGLKQSTLAPERSRKVLRRASLVFKAPSKASGALAYPYIETASLSQPCRPDCGSCISSFPNFKRSVAVVSSFLSYSPPGCYASSLHLADVRTHLTYRQESPRGPPCLS